MSRLISASKQYMTIRSFPLFARRNEQRALQVAQEMGAY